MGPTSKENKKKYKGCKANWEAETFGAERELFLKKFLSSFISQI